MDWRFVVSCLKCERVVLAAGLCRECLFLGHGREVAEELIRDEAELARSRREDALPDPRTPAGRGFYEALAAFPLPAEFDRR